MAGTMGDALTGRILFQTGHPSRCDSGSSDCPGSAYKSGKEPLTAVVAGYEVYQGRRWHREEQHCQLQA